MCFILGQEDAQVPMSRNAFQHIQARNGPQHSCTWRKSPNACLRLWEGRTQRPLVAIRRGVLSAATAVLASAHGSSPDQVRRKLLSSLGRSRSQPSWRGGMVPTADGDSRANPNVDRLLATQPLPLGAPPGLERFTTNAGQTSASTLVAPASTGRPNPPLGTA